MDMILIRFARSNPSIARVRVIVVLGAWVGYPLLFAAWYNYFGVAFTPLSIIPLTITGWLFGLWPGILGSVFLLPLHSFLFQMVGPPPASPVGPPPPSSMYGPSIFADLLIGGGVGWLSDLLEQVKKQIIKREQAEDSLRQAHDELEMRVQERTSALARVNETLEAEIGVRRRAEEGLQQRNLQATLLNELGDLLLACRTTDEAYPVVAQYAERLFSDQAGALGMINSSHNLVEIVVTWGNLPEQESVFSPDECWALRRGQIHTITDPTSHLICKHVRQPLVSRAWCVPMTAQGEALGILHLRAGPPNLRATREERDRQAEDLQSLAIAMAERIALGLVNLNLRDKLRDQAIRDPLTGLYNRRYMEETVEREVARATRRHFPFGVVLFDIDHFKDFNDTFGHSAGDAVLQEMGRVLNTLTRSEDIVCRYGGEEFVLVFPEIELPDLLQRTEQVREEIGKLDVQYQHQSVRNITVSAGVAVFPQNGSTTQALIDAADEALYIAKRTGRNRVAVAPRNETPA